MKMHLQAPENLPNAKFSRGVVPLGRGIKKRGSGMEAPQEKNLLQVPARRQVSEANDHTFWHDQGGKCDANKTDMKANERKKLTFVRPFHLVGLSVHDRPHNTRGQGHGRLNLSSRGSSDALLS